MGNNLQKNVEVQMEKWNMVVPGERVLVGVSGGADSVCLLMVLEELQKTMDFSLEAVHVEHGIRGQESQKDAEFVEKLCIARQVPLTVKHVDVPAYAKEHGLGMEEAARILRYEVFSSLAEEKHAKVALAHHMEDNAETVLFQMVRGSSLTGLCGMQPVRTDEKGITYIRPLLGLHRAEIEAFLQEKGISYCTDSTNSDIEYSRNYLRKEVIPKLNQLNEQAVAHVHQAASHLSEVKDYLDMEAERCWNEVVAETSQGIVLDLERFCKLHKVLQKEILYRAIAIVSGGKKDITSGHVEDVLSLCENQSGKSVSLPNGVVAKKEFQQLFFYATDDLREKEQVELFISEAFLNACKEAEKESVISLADSGNCFRVKVFPNTWKAEELEEKIPKNSYTKWFDYDKIRKGFCIRNRRSGDAFLCDAAGHRKKLKQYFIDEKIPAKERETMWLLAQEETVLWLVGGRISEHIKVTSDTKIIFEITYESTYDGGY